MEIIIYNPNVKARRIKIFVPYEMADERAMLKNIESRFYHKAQKMWSIVHTEANLNLLKTIFKNKYKLVDEVQKEVVPKYQLNEKSIIALAETEQRLILKAYSYSTVKNYKAELSSFFKYFENFDLKTVVKEQIESYIFT